MLYSDPVISKTGSHSAHSHQLKRPYSPLRFLVSRQSTGRVRTDCLVDFSRQVGPCPMELHFSIMMSFIEGIAMAKYQRFDDEMSCSRWRGSGSVRSGGPTSCSMAMAARENFAIAELRILPFRESWHPGPADSISRSLLFCIILLVSICSMMRRLVGPWSCFHRSA